MRRIIGSTAGSRGSTAIAGALAVAIGSSNVNSTACARRWDEGRGASAVRHQTASNACTPTEPSRAKSDALDNRRATARRYASPLPCACETLAVQVDARRLRALLVDS